MSTTTSTCFHHSPSIFASSKSRSRINIHLKPLLLRYSLRPSIRSIHPLSSPPRNKRGILCFWREERSFEVINDPYVEDNLFQDMVETSEFNQPKDRGKEEEKLPEDLVATPECNQPEDRGKESFTSLLKATGEIFSGKSWTVPWTAKTIVQVMLLWIASFWVIGSWIVPLVAHTAGFRKELLTYRGQALYSLLTDVAEGLTGIAILHRCLSTFRPLPPDWFKFSFKGNWQFDVGLGCLMFPLVNRLSQVNLSLFPILPSAPVSMSSVEQSIVARDPIAMALYAVVVSVCAPIWEEIVFRGFLLPSLTKYMPIPFAILVSSVAFALAHFNMQRMLPLIFLGIVMGAVFTRTRNLLPSMLLHSLWNAFVFLELMK